MKSNLVIIPARANSKRLPNKNVKLFNGIPLITYTLKYAINICKNSEIIVCTDCPIATEISTNLDIITLGRPYEISDDYSTTSSVLKHVLITQKNKGKIYQSVTTLQVTNPLRPINLFDNSLKLFNSKIDKDSVVSVSKNKKKIGCIVDGYFETINYKSEQRSQDMNNSFYENGLIYISKPNQILENDNLFGKKILPLEVDGDFPIVDIDTLNDFLEAETLLINNINKFDHLF